MTAPVWERVTARLQTFGVAVSLVFVAAATIGGYVKIPARMAVIEEQHRQITFLVREIASSQTYLVCLLEADKAQRAFTTCVRPPEVHFP